MKVERIQARASYAQTVIQGDIVYLPKQVASGARGASVADQTRNILASADSLLSAASGAKDRILSATIWFTEMNTFSEMNEVWDAWIEPGSTPARATVGVPALASHDFKVEIPIIAAQSTSEAS